MIRSWLFEICLSKHSGLNVVRFSWELSRARQTPSFFERCEPRETGSPRWEPSAAPSNSVGSGRRLKHGTLHSRSPERSRRPWPPRPSARSRTFFRMSGRSFWDRGAEKEGSGRLCGKLKLRPKRANVGPYSAVSGTPTRQRPVNHRGRNLLRL